MPATDAMLERSAELKHALTDFIREPRFEDALDAWFEARLSGLTVQRQEDAIDALDTFILHERLPDGRSLIECFADEHVDLSSADREMLLGWEDSVEGIFEVRRRDGDALLARNLVDDTDYHLRANAGLSALGHVQRGAFIISRIVPIADEWLLSGAQTLLPRQDRDVVYAAAADLAQHSPELVFRNPKKLEQAWELQREQRATFIDFFGGDCVTVPGSEVAARLVAFFKYQQTEARGADGLIAAERARATGDCVPEPPEPDLPDQLTAADTVALLCDEVDGLNFLPDFGLLEETFAQPELLVDRRHRNIVQNYLNEPSFSPRVIERLAARDPGRASRLFRQFLNQPEFDWQRDGEALLRRVKGAYYARPVLPAIVPLSDALAAAATNAAMRQTRPMPRAQQTKQQKRRRR